MRYRPTAAFRILLAVVVAAGIIVAFAWLRAVDHDLRIQTIQGLIGTSPWAPVIFILVSVVASFVFVPRTVFAAAAGFLFGLWMGLLWATIGSIAGSVACFLLARYLSVGIVDEAKWPRFAPILRAAERGGWRTVALIRLIPILPNTPVNYAFGVTRLSLASYTIGSALGQLPMTYVWTQLGTTGNYALSGGQWLMPTLLSLVLLAVSIILPRLPIVRRSLRLGAE